jgi:hypothetical protein
MLRSSGHPADRSKKISAAQRDGGEGGCEHRPARVVGNR